MWTAYEALATFGIPSIVIAYYTGFAVGIEYGAIAHPSAPWYRTKGATSLFSTSCVGILSVMIGMNVGHRMMHNRISTHAAQIKEDILSNKLEPIRADAGVFAIIDYVVGEIK